MAEIPADDDLIKASAAAENALAHLATVAERRLYDPHTLWRVLSHLAPTLRDAANVMDKLGDRLEAANNAGLLVADDPDADVVGDAREGLLQILAARRALDQAADHASEAEQYCATFAPRLRAEQDGETDG